MLNIIKNNIIIQTFKNMTIRIRQIFKNMTIRKRQTFKKY